MNAEQNAVPMDHFIVREARFPGSWGRGKTIEEAIKNAQWIPPGSKVHLIKCDAKAYIDEMGDLQYTERERLGTGVVSANKKKLIKMDPTGGMK